MSRKETPMQEGARLYAEQCAAKAKEAGFNLDFAFTQKPEQERLVEELMSISAKTFWAWSPFQKMEKSEVSPALQEEYDQLMARKAEIMVRKQEMLDYLAPYVPAAQMWRQPAAERPIDQRTLDRALNLWTEKYGDAHRHRFFAATTFLGS